MPALSSSETFKIKLHGDALDTLQAIAADSRRLRPQWQDTAESVLNTIILDFLEDIDPFDKFVVLRVDSEEARLQRELDRLKDLKKAARAGGLSEEAGTPATPRTPGSSAPEDSSPTGTTKNLGSRSPTAQ